MYKINKLDNPFIVIFFPIAIILINLVFSTYFIPIFLLTIVFIIFNNCINKKFYYQLFFTVLSILILENLQGFQPFTIVFLFLLIYMFVKPSLKKIFASSEIINYILVFHIYFAIWLIEFFIYGVSESITSIIFINLILDILVIGLLL